MLKPLVSIVITSYNREATILKTIESAIAQDYQNKEIIISDNCSKDQTFSVISKFRNYPFVKIYQNDENIGMWPNFSRAYYEYAKGDYLLHVSSDDYLINNSFISEAIDLINKYPSASIVWGGNISFDKNKNKKFQYRMPCKNGSIFRKGIDVFLQYPQKNTWFGAGACIVNRKLAFLTKKVHDVDLNLDLLTLGDACFIHKPSYVFTIHNSNATNSYRVKDYIEELKLYEEKAKLAIKKYPDLYIEIENWLDNCLNAIIVSIFNMLIIKDKLSYCHFKMHVQSNYPSIYKKVIRDFNFNVRKIYSFIFITKNDSSFKKI